jgi:hypothetical protein
MEQASRRGQDRPEAISSASFIDGTSPQGHKPFVVMAAQGQTVATNAQEHLGRGGLARTVRAAKNDSPSRAPASFSVMVTGATSDVHGTQTLAGFGTID